tara:strand:+ start:97 stop:441 length:345 start_codon:yes stop_codon:yes gene_type:complete
MEEIPENTDATTTRYIAYLCSPTTELRGRRDTHDNGCLQWSVRCSKTLETKMQMNCPKCENRPRVAEHEWYEFDDKATAKQFCERRNEDYEKAIIEADVKLLDDWNEGWSSGEE